MRLSCPPGAAMLAIAALTMFGARLSAQSDPSASESMILPLAEEMRLALSAAPPHLRADAGVVALTDSGFVVARPSSNGFTCVVNRDHPRSRKPVCYDAEGTATILPKVRYVGEQLLRGVPLDDVWTAVEVKFASGEFIAPRRAGVAYMLSPEIGNYNAQTGSVDGFPPHIMFYAPHVTNEDLGVSGEARRERPWLPFVGYQGPHGFIIVVVDTLPTP